MPRETAAVSARSVYTIRPCTVLLCIPHGKATDTNGVEYEKFSIVSSIAYSKETDTIFVGGSYKDDAREAQCFEEK